MKPTTVVALSVVIPTYNEAENIPVLLEQLTWAAEVLVVDSLSTDETPELVQQAGATLLERACDTIGKQKNWAIKQAKHPWVLILDADERLTPALIDEIKTLVQKNDRSYVGYEVYRQNYFMGQPLSYGGLQRDKVIRLIQRDRCAYDHKQVHEAIRTEEKVGQLQHKLLHYTYKNLQHFVQKNELYARWSAQDHQKKVKKIGYYHLLVKPVGRFLTQYILKRGFLDGQAGLVFCAVSSWAVFLRYAHLKEAALEKK
jgi:glycosyltransferase involved in cell wall biosynthesis